MEHKSSYILNMASSRSHYGFRNLKPQETVSEAGNNNGTYYVHLSQKQKAKRCPNLCSFCSIFLVFFCTVFMLGGLVGYYIREATAETTGGRRPASQEILLGKTDSFGLDPQQMSSVHENVMYDITGETIAANLRQLPDDKNTMAGGDWGRRSALKLKAVFEKLKFDRVDLERHDVVLSYPDPILPNRLQILNSTGQIELSFSLVGDTGQRRSGAVSHDKNSPGERKGDGGSKNQSKSLHPHQHVFPYVAFSSSGTVKGRLVYGHYGRPKDILTLQQENIDLEWAILLLRLGKIPLMDKISYAKETGVSGVLLYWDPVDEARASRAHRSHIPYISLGLPGKDSDEAPTLAVQTVSQEIAEALLLRLAGGRAPDNWQGGLHTTYHLGSKQLDPSSLSVSIEVNNKAEKRTIYNVIATIHGFYEPDRFILLGAPRTSFPDVAMETKLTTAMLMSTAQALYDSLHLNSIHWLPRRTVKLCSWGGAEFSNLGMNLYAQRLKQLLWTKAVTYLEINKPVVGNDTLTVTATPALHSLIYMAARRVPAPGRNEVSLYEVWSQSQYMQTGLTTPALSYYPTKYMSYPLMDRLGIPTIVYQYTPHQFTDNMTQSTSGDVVQLESLDNRHHYRFHTGIARVTSLALLMLADSHFYGQFNMSQYGNYIFHRVESLIEIFYRYYDSKMEEKISKLQNIAGRLQRLCETYDIYTSYISHKDDLVVRRLNDHFLLFDRSLLINFAPLNRRTHILSGSRGEDAFSTLGQYIQMAHSSGSWTTTSSSLDKLNRVLEEATQSLIVGE